MSFGSVLYTILIGPIKLFFEIVYSCVYSITANPGISIVFLSLAINLLVLPLYMRADAMQEEEKDIQNRLSRGVSHIRKTFKGDERMMILQTYYRQNHYKPTYVLRGAAPLFLEIPFFIAAYSFLSNLSILEGISFGPIADLSRPDGLLRLGALTVNLLPILMTLVNFVSSAIFTKGYPLKTKIQLYGMAVFFLIFLYGSPSGLVFYWTLNNLFSL
ncbi:MAG: YidC/Oxa1 family membrane protein insertase, partial [Lachnospiraceae bacterium]|nr:YidC/Oxa1 family membrane protein insertase [Lachnospiraceae bacterium]